MKGWNLFYEKKLFKINIIKNKRFFKRISITGASILFQNMEIIWKQLNQPMVMGSKLT